MSGLGDVTFLVTRPLAKSDTPPNSFWTVLGTVGLGVPSHGKIGSDNYSQQVRLTGVIAGGQWVGQLTGVLVHLNGQPAAIGSTVKVLHPEVHYVISSTTKLIGKLDRSYLRGLGGSTVATLEYEWPLTASWTGNASIVRGLTKTSGKAGAVKGNPA